MIRLNKKAHLMLKLTFYLVLGIILFFIFLVAKLLFFPLVASVLLTLIFDPIVNRLETKGISRSMSILLIYVVILFIIGITIVFVVPRGIKEVKNISYNLPQYKQRINEVVTNIQIKLEEKFPNANIPDLNDVISKKVFGKTTIDIDALMSYMSSFFAILSLVVIIPIVTYFLLADGYFMQKKIMEYIPNSYFEIVILLTHRILEALKLFIRGQFIDAAAVGVLTTIGLTIIGLPYSILIGLIAGMANLVPYLGPIMGFIPAFFVILVQSGDFSTIMLIKVIIVFVAVQFIEGTFVYPIAVGKSVNLHPLLVIIGVTVGGQIAGIVGMLLAVPTISILKVTFELMYSYLKSYSVI